MKLETTIVPYFIFIGFLNIIFVPIFFPTSLIVLPVISFFLHYINRWLSFKISYYLAFDKNADISFRITQRLENINNGSTQWKKRIKIIFNRKFFNKFQFYFYLSEKFHPLGNFAEKHLDDLLGVEGIIYEKKKVSKYVFEQVYESPKYVRRAKLNKILKKI
jgi:DNA replicative helicase MCM subunit Mcm2 (Cdc46/Mcm family)